MNNLNKILVGLLVAQVGLFFAVRAKGDGTTIAKSEALLPGLKAETATKVQIWDTLAAGKKEGSPAVVLEKQGDKWVATSHGDYPADGASIDTFVGKFSAMQSRGAIATSTKRHDQLGVGAGRYERKVVIDHAGGSSTIYLGVAPKFRKTAVRIGTAKETFAVGAPTRSDATADITEWIDPVYMALGKDAIVSLTVENKSGSISLEKGDDKQWKTAGADNPAAPAAPGLDQAEVGKLIDSLTKIEMTDIVAKTASASHGFDKAAARITVGLDSTDKSGGAPKREVFIIEVGNKDGGSYVIRSLDKGYVVKVATAKFDPFVDLTAKKLEAKPGDAKKPGNAPQLPPGMRLPPGTKLPPGFKLPPGMRRPAPPR